MDLKEITACLRMAATGIHVYFVLFDLMLAATKGQVVLTDKHSHLHDEALRQFNGLFNITKVLFKYSYADSNDKVFMQEEKLLEMMTSVV